MRSLRARLILTLIGCITLFLAGAGFAFYAFVRVSLRAEHDRALILATDAAAPHIVLHVCDALSGESMEGEQRGPDEARDGPRPADRPAHGEPERWDEVARGPPPPRPNPVRELLERDDFVLQVWGTDGTPLLASASLGDTSFERLGRGLEPFGPIDFSASGAPLLDLQHPRSGAPLRAIVARFSIPPLGGAASGTEPGTLELILASDTSQTLATLARLRNLMILAWLVSSLGCAAILAVAVQRGLRPLGALSEQLREVDEQRLGRRFELAAPPLELVPVIDQLHASFGRLGAAFEREQAFSADAAHELLTPLTGLRSTLELALARPRSGEELRSAAQTCLEITCAMQAIVGDLFDLARLGALARAGEVGTEQRVELAGALAQAWVPWAQRARERGLEFVSDFAPGAAVRLPASLLERVLANVLENAVDYADPGGPLLATIRALDGRVELELSNRAPAGTPDDLAQRAFEAFWRADKARSANGRHAGLGLALCRRIVGATGGQLTARYADGQFALCASWPEA